MLGSTRFLVVCVVDLRYVQEMVSCCVYGMFVVVGVGALLVCAGERGCV